jgi:hypothetical protein
MKHMERLTNRNHLFRSFTDKKVLIDESRRKFLLQQLTYIKDQSELLKQTTLVQKKKLIQNLKDSSKLALENLDFIIMNCLKMTEKIKSLSVITHRTLTPYERFICSSNDPFLEFLQAPKVKISSKTFAFELVLPTFIQEMTNFSCYSVAFKENAVLTVPKSNILHHSLFNGSSRCLSISPKKLLVTGLPSNKGEDTCVEVDLAMKTIKPGASLNVTRKWHAMAWLNDWPCVVGGNDSRDDLRSVEVLKNDFWVEMPSLVVPRSSLSAVCYLDKLWVVGGINLETMNSVEVFFEDSWKLLGVKNEILCSSVALFGLGKYLVIFGGFRGKDNSSLSLFDVENHDLTQVSEFPEEFYFNLNSVGISSEEIFTIDANYSLKVQTKSSLYPKFKEVSEIVNDPTDLI